MSLGKLWARRSSGFHIRSRFSDKSLVKPRSDQLHLQRTRQFHKSEDSSNMKVAVLYQAIDPPVVNGVRKPMKPGGYRDSGADIAYGLERNNVSMVTPKSDPDPASDDDWCFPDNEEGIISAISKGVTHLWANTILFSSHPLQTSAELDQYASQVKVVGQPPELVDQFDDKNYVNSVLRTDGRFALPRSWTVDSSSLKPGFLEELPYPIVGKPIRGRGSHGVKLCQTKVGLASHLNQLLSESPQVMLEEYLAGQEGTVTVMPPSKDHPHYQSLPIVVRFNHEDGIAPYNGIVAVTANSRVLSDEETEENDTYSEICRACELAAEKLKVTAPIRIDVRRFEDDPKSKFAIFDVNMKPNMTGPGRPGRENQASLTALAGAKLGWDYPELLKRILITAQPLQELRQRTIP